MKRYVVKGLNYTRVETEKTIQVWMLDKPRKPKDCGIWIDGEKKLSFESMVLKQVESPSNTEAKS